MATKFSTQKGGMTSSRIECAENDDNTDDTDYILNDIIANVDMASHVSDGVRTKDTTSNSVESDGSVQDLKFSIIRDVL